MKQIFIALIVIVAVIALIIIIFTINQVSSEDERLKNDMVYRSTLLADSLKETIEPNFINKSEASLQNVVDRFTNKERFAGLGIYDNKGTAISVSSTIPEATSSAQQIVADAMDEDKANGDFTTFGGRKVYALAVPIHDDKSVVGALLVVQNAGYIDVRLQEIWKNNLVRFLLQASLLSLAMLLLIRWIIYEPIKSLVETLRQTRFGGIQNSKGLNNSFLFRPLQREISHMQQNLIQARLAVTEEAKANLEKLDSPWTAERLKEFVKELLRDQTIVVVSNREPYVHTKVGGKIIHYIPASGMATAIEPVMQATGGIWIANGNGDADKLVVDKNDTIQVPPDDPKYTLKRVWLTDEEENGYYNGFSNEGLWPLLHVAHVRPIFRKEDWEQYKRVNGKFAEVVLSEIKKLHKPVVFIQDFHFSLLPRMIKNSRPDAIVGLFWHIPWVSPEAFSICPWKKEILDGMLGADLIGFHTQQYCNNFIETVGHQLESLIDLEQFTVARNDHISFIKPFPISIAFSNSTKPHSIEKEETEGARKILENLGIEAKYIGVGVDRLDYTKGILERIKAVELFLTKYPAYIGQFTFLQISPPSKRKTKKDQEFAMQVEKEVERINEMFKAKKWKPIVFIQKLHSHEELSHYYKLANFCLVTSLHDGMNIVSKEYVAARNDESGVLIISQFAGASKEFKDALVVNPYNGEQTADALYAALIMSPIEQTKRMRKLRNSVRNNNIYRWSAEFLKTIVSLG